MFQVHVNDGSQNLPTDDIFYIVAKEGIFLKKKMGIMESLAPVKNISILDSVATSAKMHIEKIPAQTFAKVMEFFKQVYDEHQSEAIVLLFYNEGTKKYKVIPPKQTVSFASLNYERSITIKDYTMIGDIHSHGSMSAFHSGTDHDDEKTFDGLHITIGNASSPNVSISTSIVANGYRFLISDPSEYIGGIKLIKDVDEKIDKIDLGYTTKIYKSIDGKMILDEPASKLSSSTYHKIDNRYVSVISPSKRQINKSWMEQVEKVSYAGVFGYGAQRRNHQGAFTGRSYINGKWEKYNPNNFWDYGYNSPYHKVGTTPPSNIIYPTTEQSKPQTQLPLFSKFDKDEDDIPCRTCKYKEEKLSLEEYLDEEFYECQACGLIISGDSDELVCPTCKTDNYLSLLEENDLVNNYEKESDLPTYICPTCYSEVYLNPAILKCPICHTPAYDSEEERIKTFEADSGEHAYDDETEKVNAEALRQISVQENIKKIPDPEKNEIPIPIKVYCDEAEKINTEPLRQKSIQEKIKTISVSSESNEPFWKSKFKQVFGR